MEGARTEATLDYPQEHLIVKFEIILPLLGFSLDLLTNKHFRTWIYTTNLWIDSRTCQKERILLSVRQRSNNYVELSSGEQ